MSDCVVGGCDTPEPKRVEQAFYDGQPDGAWLDLCWYHREMFADWGWRPARNDGPEEVR